eukprot:TRINITY_DN775_c0_g1_i1.p1 TRINITY_DN775_c0_g1~~TRINITY_DN775_c0_g1_i1.p1  ORF type:complete len:463 (-),score=16.83 TRINITY_DN775_c0_g1_i1:349-1593(-)
MSVKHVDIAIIGGGPAGCTTCYGLQRVLGNSVKIQVFERASSIRPVGGLIGIGTQENLTMALNCIHEGLYDEVLQVSHPRNICKVFDTHGNFVQEIFDSKNTSYVVPWYKYQSLMMDKLFSDSVNVGYQLETIQQNDKEVKLGFSNGKIVQAKIVIGADGNYSKTRMALFGEVPKFFGQVSWRFQCLGFHADIPPSTYYQFKEEGKLLAIQCCPDHFNREEEEKYRTFVSGFAPWPEERLHELEHIRYSGPQTVKSPSKIKERFFESMKEFPQKYLGWIEKHLDENLLLEHAIYIRDPNSPWGKGRVSMVGDAAHVLPPIGLGLPFGVEDALELSHCINDFGISQEALREYEKRRQQRVTPIQKRTLKNYWKGYQSDSQVQQGSVDQKPLTLSDFIKDYYPKTLKITQNLSKIQ